MFKNYCSPFLCPHRHRQEKKPRLCTKKHLHTTNIMAICHTVTIKSFLNALFPNILDLLHTLTFSLHFGLQFFGTTVHEKEEMLM